MKIQFDKESGFIPLPQIILIFLSTFALLYAGGITLIFIAGTTVGMLAESLIIVPTAVYIVYKKIAL